MESAKYPSKKQCKQSKNLTLEKALAALIIKLKKTRNNDISKIIKMERPDSSPAVYSLLQHSQPTAASVEKSYCVQQKLLAKDRNFELENVKQYMILHFKSCTW